MVEDAWIAAIAAVAGYLAGSISPSYILTRALKGDDIRKVGTLNAGTLNAFNSLGKKGGAFVFLFDFGKGLFAALVPGWLGLPEAATYAAAVAVVAGHNWPVWLKFVGGKGVATSAGVAVGLIPLLAAAALAPAVILLVTLKKFAIVAMGTGFVLLVALTYITGQSLGVFIVIFGVSALVAIAQFTRPTWVRPEDAPPGQ
ncbi:MAG: glycerol-3-phosphate acyltransferase [Chloroflexota bacterium]|nr:glycerol-3-phosphate acyltransferase [Chloroflexota bacterium]MDE2969606.1 glycerol-3-phosphate acyltransferase [Chloroflexota bacterium]